MKGEGGAIVSWGGSSLSLRRACGAGAVAERVSVPVWVCPVKLVARLSRPRRRSCGRKRFMARMGCPVSLLVLVLGRRTVGRLDSIETM